MFSPAGVLLATSSQLCDLKKTLHFSLEQCMTVMFRIKLEAGSKIKIYQMHSVTGNFFLKKEHLSNLCLLQ